MFSNLTAVQIMKVVNVLEKLTCTSKKKLSYKNYITSQSNVDNV